MEVPDLELPRPPVIVAEDDPAMLKLLGAQLRSAGYEVATHPNGRAAFDDLRGRDHCLLVADWDMPEMSGIELCQAVRELQALDALQSVHITIVTAFTDKAKVIEGLEAGADDYLTKPYHREELLARIRAGERTLMLQQELHHHQWAMQKAFARLQVLNQRLEEMASRDALTGLYNRRKLFERLESAWREDDADATRLGCVMLDVDHFKSVNDQFGHDAGDLVLTTCGQLIRKHLGPLDFCARFGGEEFLVICPNTNAGRLYGLAERIRDAMSKYEHLIDGQSLRTSVSIGAVLRSPDHSAPDRMLTEADRLLYEAKRNGRNQTWFRTPDGVAQVLEPQHS
jgi:diguanylate cyclase (GGDEF)-like protein